MFLVILLFDVWATLGGPSLPYREPWKDFRIGEYTGLSIKTPELDCDKELRLTRR